MGFDLETIRQQLTNLLHSNQFASGGLLLGAIAWAIALLRGIPQRLTQWVWKHATVTIEISSYDLLFDPVAKMLDNRLVNGRARSYRAKLAYNKDNRPVINLSPGVGWNLLWFKWRPILVYRSYFERQQAQWGGSPPEQIQLTIFGRNHDRIQQFLSLAYQANLTWQEQVRIYGVSEHYGWAMESTATPRPPASIVLPAKTFEAVASDLDKFFRRKEWYARLGIPYRRGYLLSGPPGNGKTTSIAVFAGIHHASLYVIDLASTGLSDTKLRRLVNQTADNAFIVFEDIDAIFTRRINREEPRTIYSEGAKPDTGGVTLSGLLNAIDGVASPSGRVIFMSTNFPERLDAAILRPGRVDLHIKLKNATDEQAGRLFQHFFGDDVKEAQEFGEVVGGERLSMAEIQNLLIGHADSPARALAAAKELYPQPAHQYTPPNGKYHTPVRV